ncbi:MAG: hypothetical protein KJ702_08905, partial [Gammaproteobacteria bacterium]|nr:hypothetical protein [Gammaproteobacteria bacterium]
KYFRFMNSVQELTEEMLARLTQIDYSREMALAFSRFSACAASGVPAGADNSSGKGLVPFPHRSGFALAALCSAPAASGNLGHDCRIDLRRAGDLFSQLGSAGDLGDAAGGRGWRQGVPVS